MDINKVKYEYEQSKQVLMVLSDADHPLHNQLIRVCSIETAERLEEFVRGLDEHGFQLLYDKQSN